MREEYDFTNAKTNLYMVKEVKRFLDTHRDIKFSAAKFEYSIYSDWEESEQIIEIANRRCLETQKDLEMREIIEKTTEPSELLRLMRKELSGTNRSLLRAKIVKYEKEILPLIKEKCIRNKQDVFIENALHFFMRSTYNCCDWIIENYFQFHSEYLKCMLCLVLGLRGEVHMIPFLIAEAKRMEKEYPDETYDQGPTLAVHELAKILFEEG